MLPELLPYKYSNLKFSDQYSQKALVSLGWKARKYIRWADVHVDNDRDLLKGFADKAIDEEKLDLNSFPRVNEILLNVQKWRLDKENFSVEPEHSGSWDRARALIEGANESPGIISSFLAECGIELKGWSNENIFRGFENSVIAELVVNVRSPKLKIDFSELASKNSAELIESLRELIPVAEELDSIKLQHLTSVFGLPVLERHSREIPNNVSSKNITVVSYERLPMTELFRASESSETKTVLVNENNAFVAEMRSNELSETILKRFMKVLAEVSEKRSVNEKQISDFVKHLALSLDNEFEDLSDEDFD